MNEYQDNEVTPEQEEFLTDDCDPRDEFNPEEDW